MRRDGWKQMLVEGWAFIAVAILAFAGGLLVGDLGASPETKTVYLSSATAEGEEAMGPSGEMMEGEGAESPTESTGSAPGSALFASVGCGSCHTLSAAGSTGTTGPNLDESLAPDDNTQGIEEMILNPNEEVIEGYPPNVMPQNYSQTLSKPEIHELAEYLVATTPAKPSP
jgi:mono/diheme cytochrome c family protein